MKLRTALSWALDDDLNGRTFKVPPGVGMIDSSPLLRLAVIWMDELLSELGGVDGMMSIPFLWKEGIILSAS